MKKYTMKDLNKLMSIDYMTRKQRKEFERYKRGLIMRELIFRYGKRCVISWSIITIVICVGVVAWVYNLIVVMR